MSFSNSEEKQGRELASNDEHGDMPDRLERQAEQHQREMAATVGVGKLPEDDDWRERAEHYRRTGELGGPEQEEADE